MSDKMSGKKASDNKTSDTSTNTSTNTSIVQLLPCPFCGGEAKIITKNSVDECYGVRCTNFGCVAFDILPCYIEEAQAIAAWNTRKPMERIVEKLEMLKEGRFVLDESGEVVGLEANNTIHVDDAIEIVKEEGAV